MWVDRGEGLMETITDTCDLDRLVMPKVSTSLSIRRVKTPSR